MTMKNEEEEAVANNVDNEKRKRRRGREALKDMRTYLDLAMGFFP